MLSGGFFGPWEDHPTPPAPSPCETVVPSYSCTAHSCAHEAGQQRCVGMLPDVLVDCGGDVLCVTKKAVAACKVRVGIVGLPG